MSDDLVKRLRSQIGDDVREIYSHEALFRLAADRIEELEAAHNRMTHDWGKADMARMDAEARADAAEAKLREAVEIAKSIVRDWESTDEDRWPGGAEEECSSYASRASRIARLTGETQE